MNRSIPCILVLALALTGTSGSASVRNDRFLKAQELGIVRTLLIDEASGIVASRKSPGVIWVHNDSGDAPRLFAIDKGGRLLGICTIVGADEGDWEDIAIGPGPDPNQQYLYIGDIGDNNGQHPWVQVHRVSEPDLDPTRAFGEMRIGPPETIELTYPGGARDAETLLVDPQTRDIFVITKRELFCKVYRAAWPQSTTSRTMLEQVAVLPWAFATGGDVSPDGREVIVRSPDNASLWTRADGEPLWRAFQGSPIGLPLANEPQGEAISFDSKGQGYFTLSEGDNPRLYYFGRIADKDNDQLSDTPPQP